MVWEVVQMATTLTDSKSRKCQKQTAVSQLLDILLDGGIARQIYHPPIPQAEPTSACQQCRNNRPARWTRLSMTMAHTCETHLLVCTAPSDKVADSEVCWTLEAENECDGPEFSSPGGRSTV